MLRMIPPAAAPIEPGVILRNALFPGGNTEPDRFRDLIRDYLDVKHVFLASSGRAALFMLLKVMSGDSRRDEVIIPSYTCFSVPSAVVRAGLKIRLCDIDRDTLDLNPEALAKADWGKVLCVVPSGLFGLPSDLPGICRTAGKNGAYVIDDAAQSFGGGIGENKSGSSGEAGILSLGRGKVLSTYEGGVIVTDSDEIGQKLSRLPEMQYAEGSMSKIGLMARLLGYSVFVRPELFWIPSRLPFLELGVSRFDPDFPVSGLSVLQARIGSSVFGNLDRWNDARRRHAERLREAFMDRKDLILPRLAEGARPVYIRFPVLVTSDSLRERIRTALIDGGIGASTAYPSGVHRIPGISPHLANPGEEFPRADFVAGAVLTMPTHPLLSDVDLNRMIDVTRKCLN